MPSAPTAPGPRPQRAPDRWRTAGLALLAVCGALIVVVILSWVRASFFTDVTENPEGSIRVYGAPFVLLALGLLWWVLWLARALLRGRHEGWHALMVLGWGAALISASFLLIAYGFDATDLGPTDVPDPGVPLSFLAQQLGVLAIGLLSVVVAVFGGRAWAAADAAATGADSGTTQGFTDQG